MPITRVSRDRPCAICGGWPELPRGQGKRCAGFTTSDGEIAFCDRSERAGQLKLDEKTEPPAYAHHLFGECGCGVEHNLAKEKLNGQKGKIIATYPYHDTDGNVLFEVVRYEPKAFKQRRPDGAGGWAWHLGACTQKCKGHQKLEKPVLKVPYRLPELMASVGQVFILEGEKDVDRALSMGIPATTAPGGAGKWTKDMVLWLRGRPCVIPPDNDPVDPITNRRPGPDGAQLTARLLTAAKSQCRILELPNLGEHGDISDWFDASAENTVAALALLVESAPVFEPAESNGEVKVSEDDSSGDFGIFYTDTRNARRLVAAHGEGLRFDHTRGKWRIWDGQVWAMDETAHIMRLAKDIVKDMYKDVDWSLDEDERKEQMKAILRVESTGRLRAMIENAASEVYATHKTWDQDPYWLNCNNGTIDLHTGELLEHRSERWQSKLAPVDYDPAAKCPRWDTFLLHIFDGDKDLVRFVQRSIGLSLIGEVIEHVLYVLWGTGANGKSTFLNVVLEMLGDYGRAAAPDLLMHTDSPQHSTNIAELRGVRLVSAVETQAGGRISEALVKMLTGGDVRNARFLFQDAFTYIPSDTFWLATNHKPVVQGNSEGIWRRLKLIPFNVSIPTEDQDHGLPNALREEYSGILAWAVRGCVEWQKDGLGESDTVKVATASYRSEMDTLNAFLEERCVQESGANVPSQLLYTIYSDWCETSGEKIATQRFLGLRLGERGFTRVRVPPNNRWGWEGLRLLRDGEKPESGEVAHTPVVRQTAIDDPLPVVSEPDEDEGLPKPEAFTTNAEYLDALEAYWKQKGEPVG